MVISCSSTLHSDSISGANRINAGKEQMSAIVKVGDNIFEARDELLQNGFDIRFGPELVTVDKNQYSMTVGYGVEAGPSAYLSETMGWGRIGKSHVGVVSADNSGIIFRVE